MNTSSASGQGTLPKRSLFRNGGYRPQSTAGWIFAIIVLIVLILAAAVALLWLPPGWYRPIRRMNDTVYNQADHAQASLMALRNQLSSTQPGTITWTVTQREVNSLLAVVYGMPVKSKSSQSHRGGITYPFVHFSNNEMTFAARDGRIPGDAVVSVGVRIELFSDAKTVPQARIAINALRIGHVPLPPSLITDRLKAVLPGLLPVVEKIIDVYAGPRYATVAAPQIVASIAAVVSGKPFAAQLRFNNRRLVVDKLVIHGPYVDASGRREPAALTIELIPKK